MSLGKTMDPMLGKERTDRLGASKSECQLVVSGMSPGQQLALLRSVEPHIREACEEGGFMGLLPHPWALEMLLRRGDGAEGQAPGPAEYGHGVVRAWEG